MRLLSVLAMACAVVLAGCGESYDSLSEETYPLTNYDSTAVTFPAAYEGEVLLVGYVYTQCPDICSVITANMRNIHDALEGDTEGVRFVTITFDPARDTPAQLARYAETFGLQDRRWDLLTGDADTIDALMQRMGVRRALAGEDAASFDGTFPEDEDYIIDHTDRMTLIDGQGRIRDYYMGSRMPAEMVAEDINHLRRERS